jgi:hypothetical protein
MKIISAHQPAYIPWLGYFHKLMVCDHFVIMDDVQFEKNSFTNRNKVLAHGIPLMLTIPVSTTDYTLKRLRDIEIADERWKSKHLRTIDQSYRKLACFNEIFPMLEKAVSIKSKFLIDYTNSILIDFVHYLQIETPLCFASELKITSKKLDYVIELTHRLGGKVFVFGPLGRSYSNEEVLRQNNIRAYFQDYIHPLYSQNRDVFIPYLSVLDLLMRYGRSSKDIISLNNIRKEHVLSNG